MKGLGGIKCDPPNPIGNGEMCLISALYRLQFKLVEVV